MKGLLQIGLVLLFFVFTKTSKGQLSIQPSDNALLLAQQLMGNGARVSNANLVCPGNAAGVFTSNSVTGLELTGGILLTTGSVQNIAGTANNAGNSLNYNNTGAGLSDLQQIANSNTEDACYLDMTIIPVCDTLRISYVFASEEYPDYVGRYYNDVFAFLVSGPNPNGGSYSKKNIALVPGSTQAVCVNSINNGLYNNGPCANCNYYINNASGSSIAYDGITKQLKAEIAVVPCNSYELRIAIADVKDGAYDSGVFIENGGVSCNLPVDVSIQNDTVCRGQIATLYASAPYSGQFSWNNGTQGNTLSANVDSTTTFTVSYAACGNVITKSAIIVVRNDSGPSYQFPSSVFCKGDPNPVPVISLGGGTFSSDDGLLINEQSGLIDLDNMLTGTYTLNFTANGTCAIQSTQKIYIHNKPQAQLTGDISFCSGTQALPIKINLTGSSPWMVKADNGQITYSDTLFNAVDSLYFTTSGGYQITYVSDSTGCIGSSTGASNVNIFQSPTATLEGGGYFCFNESPKPLTLSFSGKAPFNLNYQHSSTNHTITAQNNYTEFVNPGVGLYKLLAITDGNGCFASLTDSILIERYPSFQVKASATEVIACKGDSIKLKSTGAQHYYWIEGSAILSFKDSLKYLIQNQTQLKVIGADMYHCHDTAVISINPYPSPQINFQVSSICAGDTLALINQTTIDSSAFITGYKWYLNDSVISTSNDTNYYPPVCNNYSIRLEAFTSDGCKANLAKDISVACHPEAKIINAPVTWCVGSDALFHSQIASQFGASSYSWYVDEIPVSAQPIYDAKQISAGEHQIMLKVITQGGCTDSVLQQVTVIEKPQANFNSSEACHHQPTRFYNTSRATSSNIIKRWWDFNSDGLIDDTTKNPMPVFIDAGIHQSRLIIETDLGCRDTTYRQVIVNELPLVDFTSEKICEGDSITLINKSTTGIGTLARFFWYINNDNICDAITQNTKTVFFSDGLKPVKLITSTLKGCKDSITKQVRVFPKPNAIFSIQSAGHCEPAPVTFINSSNINSPSFIHRYHWNFDDGDKSFLANPDHIYKSGVYKPSLIITSTDGCTDTLIVDSLLIRKKPVAQFNHSPVQPTLLMNEITFTTNSEGGNKFEWKYPSTLQLINEQNNQLIVQATDTGSYLIQQMVTTEFGCTDTLEKEIRVISDFTFYLPNSFTPNGDGLNEVFVPEGIYINTLEEYKIEIFSRDNTPVFKTDKPNEGWNGHLNNTKEMCPQGVYIYLINFKDANGKPYEYSGQITLLR